MINGKLKQAGELYHWAKETDSQMHKNNPFGVGSNRLRAAADDILFDESLRLGVPFSRLKAAVTPITPLAIVEDLQYGQS